MQSWESDLQATFSDDQWLSVIHYSHRASHCITHWELNHKIILRWYFPPYRLAKFYPNQSSLCWRGCGQVGNFLHTLWQCRNLNSFWHQTFRLTPNLPEITAMVNLNYSYEHALSLRINSFNKFEKAWKVWSDWPRSSSQCLQIKLDKKLLKKMNYYLNSLMTWQCCKFYLTCVLYCTWVTSTKSYSKQVLQKNCNVQYTVCTLLYSLQIISEIPCAVSMKAKSYNSNYISSNNV